MDDTVIKAFFNSCRDAKKILELMPQLPQGLTPRHVQIIDTLHQLEQQGGPVKISDISDALQVTRPSITRLVAELAELGYIAKNASPTDGRVIIVSLTEAGTACYFIYVKRYHGWIGRQINGSLTEAELATAASATRRFYETLKNANAPKL